MRLKRIGKCITTPTSSSEFSEEEAIVLIFKLGLSRNKYLILRNALIAKGNDILPSYFAVLEKKKSIIPQIISVTNEKASVDLSTLLDSVDSLKKINNMDAVLMCKWGCDGLSNGSENSTDYKNVFMSSLVPLRLRVQNTGPSTSSKAYEDQFNTWI